MESLDKPLVNRVAESGLITIDLEDFIQPVTFLHFDLKDYLFQGLVLREKEYRAALKEFDWQQCADNVVLVYCSTDAIIPKWAYMLVTANAGDHAKDIYFGSEQDYRAHQVLTAIEAIETESYADARVVVKGCSRDEIPESAYMAILRKLQPHVRSLMYGEPCSTVPVYKRRS